MSTAMRLLAKRRVLLFALGLSLLPVLAVSLAMLGVVPESHLRVLRPSLVAIFPLATGYLALRLSRSSGTSSLRQTLSDGAFAATTLLLCSAAVGLELGRRLDRLTIIVVVDRSRSIDLVPLAAEQIEREIVTARAGMRADDALGVVVFGARAATEQPAAERDSVTPRQQAIVARDGTDIDAGLRRALAEVPIDSAARVVLISDGVETRGEAMAGAAAALAATTPVDVLVLEQSPVDDVRVVSVRGPARADAGETVDLRVVTNAPRATTLELRVKRNGQLIRKGVVEVAGGETVLRVREKLPEAGLHRYDVEITANEPGIDSFAEDNAGTAFVRVRGKSSALVLEGDAGKAAFVRAVLEKAELTVDEAGAVGVPADVGGFARYDLVVLSDIPASSLAREQLSALKSYVRDFGGGLLLLGGDRSMGPGGYGKTPVEEIAPVSFDLKQDERRASLAEVIAIDISGSMAAQVAGTTKLALANEAAARAAALLGPADRIGVAHVDTVVHWSVPLRNATDAAAIEQAIRAVGPGGGGIEIPITLRESYAALAEEAVNTKHLLVFADGDDADQIELGMPLTQAAKEQGTTTSVIALGGGKDAAALEQMAKLGGGRFYLIEDATRLPAVFAQETILAARSALVEEPFRVVGASLGQPGAGIDFATAPELGGYVVTLPKARAAVHLLGPEGDPILATWSVGVGRAGAFTSDFKDRWGSAWTKWPGGARLLAQTARDLARRGDDDRVRMEAVMTGAQAMVRVVIVGDNGRAQSFRRLRATIAGPGDFAKEVALEATGPGTYSAALPVDRPGTYLVSARDEASGALVATTGVVLSAGEELRATGTDRATLARIAAFTHGRVRQTLAGVFDDRSQRRFAYRDIQHGLLLASALALLLAVAARKLGVPEAWVDAWQQLRAGRRARSAVAPAAVVPATMGALLAAKGRARDKTVPAGDAVVTLAPAKVRVLPHAPPQGASPAPAAAEGPAARAPAKAATTAEILLAKRRGRK